jgi:hypothetical protein
MSRHVRLAEHRPPRSGKAESRDAPRCICNKAQRTALEKWNCPEHPERTRSFNRSRGIYARVIPFATLRPFFYVSWKKTGAYACKREIEIEISIDRLIAAIRVHWMKERCEGQRASFNGVSFSRSIGSLRVIILT